MRPPICAVCDKDFRANYNEGGLLSFQLTEKDKEILKKFDQNGFIGHPPAKEWFCSEHFEEAKKLTHLTLPEAMKILNNKFKQ